MSILHSIIPIRWATLAHMAVRSFGHETMGVCESDSDLPVLSERLLMQVRMEESTDVTRKELADMPLERLILGLAGDGGRKTFWINIYNAWFQILATEFDLRRPEIFRLRIIPIAGIKLSLDEIEHGILRRFRWKFSLGYLPNPFQRRIVRQLAVKAIDYRIHFALNCGAESCPMIAFYHAPEIEMQLEMATDVFLSSEAKADQDSKTLTLSKIFQWFQADFGGYKGIRKMLSQRFNIDLHGYRILFAPYNWDSKLHAFVQQDEK